MDWDNLKYFLSIARGGSLSAAARNLHVNQTTVSRRLAALEKQLGEALFFRSRKGLYPTQLGEKLIIHAEHMETEVLKISWDTKSYSQMPRGNVRIATMPWVFNYLLVPKLAGFSRRFPQITILAISGIRDRPLAKREAELALRFEIKAGRHEKSIRIAEFPYSLYAPAGEDPKWLPWTGFYEEFLQAAPQTWLEQHQEPGEDATFLANDAGIIYRAVKAGLGKGLIPDVLAENDPELQRISGAEPEIVRTLSLLVHEDMFQVARVQAVVNWLEEVFKKRSHA